MNMRIATFCRSYVYALRRSAVDARSRRFVLKVSFFGLYVVACVAVFGIAVPFRSSEGPVWYYGFYSFILLTGLLAFFLLRRRNAQAHEALIYSLTTGQTFAFPGAADDKGAIRDYLVGPGGNTRIIDLTGCC